VSRLILLIEDDPVEPDVPLVLQTIAHLTGRA
jgi:hypothetical protein